jgi:hypothetical protein
VGADGATVGKGVIAAKVARATQAGVQVTSTIAACFAGGLPKTTEKALEGQDHLPVLAYRPEDDDTTKNLSFEANAIRDQYLVLSGGGALDMAEIRFIRASFEQVAKIGAKALEVAAPTGPSTVTLTQLAQLHAALNEVIALRRAEAKKKAWLDGGELAESKA